MLSLTEMKNTEMIFKKENVMRFLSYFIFHAWMNYQRLFFYCMTMSGLSGFEEIGNVLYMQPNREKFLEGLPC